MVALLLLGAALHAATAAAAANAAGPASPAEGTPVDAAPWGELTTWEDGKARGVLWEDPRDVVRVVAEFAEDVNPDAKIRLQWWQSQWPEHRIPREQVSGAGESGWLNIGDWYQGEWRDGDTRLEKSGRVWTFTFRPVNAREYPALKDFAAPYRTTQKVRLTGSGTLQKIAGIRAYTDSVWRKGRIDWELGGTSTADRSQDWSGGFEMFNGYSAPLSAGTAGATLRADGTWECRTSGKPARVRADVWYTESPNVNSFDRTLITVRAKQASFTVDARNVVAGTNVFSTFYGVSVRNVAAGAGAGGEEPVSGYADAVKTLAKRTVKPLYEAVFDEPEQSLARAIAEIPVKAKDIYFPVGCEGGRQRFGIEPDGSVFCVNDRIDQPKGRDSGRLAWGGNRLRYGFGLPDGAPVLRWIENGCLPMIHERWDKDGVRYEQTVFATRLEAGGLGFPEMKADDTTVLMMRVMVRNLSDHEAAASAAISLQADDHAKPLELRDGLLYAKLPGGGEKLRCQVQVPDGAEARIADGRFAISGLLPANAEAFVVVKIPFITLDRDGEVERLRGLDFAAEFERVRSFWQARADAGAQIRVPVREIESFYKADVSHLMINCGREVGTDRLMARVGGFGYGVYGNESCMMITDLDRRGYHQEAERCLETFLAYQGTVALPGDYASQKGVFNGANGWESGGYNQHHGWILWAMAEHHRYSGDDAWLRRNADRLLVACDWITHERSRTKEHSPSSLRGIERGLLPPGSLEDIGDWRCWLSNNGFSWWGMDALAKELASINHPAAARLQAEADGYKADILRDFNAAMERSPLVPLRDGTWIPQIPSEVHRRGRTFGWITTTLEGPIYLIRTGLLSPGDPRAALILQDYEDNLYLSDEFGYSPEKHLSHWFSRGGFSMQPNLLCSPHPYLMRDEIKHFLRSYFNAFAACYFPTTQMMTEHPLPDLGQWRGDHYKSSDESNSTFWLRLMFVDERGADLYLGMALPRAWLADGMTPSIERAATYFGPMSLRFSSQAAAGTITASYDPPKRRVPGKVFLRFRHPEGARMTGATVDGKEAVIDADKEWVVIPPGARSACTVVARYAGADAKEKK